MTMKAVMTFAVVATALACGSCGKVDAEEKRQTVIGTLTCITAETPAQARADARLSCNFKSINGSTSDYNGYIARFGPPDLPPGKRVLVWTVLGTKPIELGALTGTYYGETGGRPAGILKGDNVVRLEPVTNVSQIGQDPIPTVLELRLEATKV
jgi:hypothetical protein